MSEIYKGIPETVTQQAKVIDFETARGRRFERTQKQALKGVDRSRTAFTPLSTEVPTEANQPPQDGKRVELSSSAGKTGEIRPLAENTHTVIDFQKAWENRLVDDPDTGAIPETHTFTPHEVKPRPIDAKDIVFHDSAYNELHNGAFARPMCRLSDKRASAPISPFLAPLLPWRPCSNALS